MKPDAGTIVSRIYNICVQTHSEIEELMKGADLEHPVNADLIKTIKATSFQKVRDVLVSIKEDGDE